MSSSKPTGKTDEEYIKDIRKKVLRDNGTIDIERLLNFDIDFAREVGDIINKDLEFANDIKKNQLDKKIRGDIMDDKDLELFRRDISQFIKEQVGVMSKDFNEKFDGLNQKMDAIDGKVNKNCEDGKCINSSISGISEVVEKLNDEMLELKNSSKIDGLSEKVEKACEGIDCINKRFEEQDLDECPSCGFRFKWNSSITHCPNCGVELLPDE